MFSHVARKTRYSNVKGRGDESYSLEYEFVTGPFPNHTVTEVDLFCNLS